MSRRVCGCGTAYLVNGHPDGEVYICPNCRAGHVPITLAFSPDLSAQLAAVTAERDRLAADLDAVRRAAWAFLAVAGAHGRYDAARCYDARQALRLLVGEPPPAPDHAED